MIVRTNILPLHLPWRLRDRITKTVLTASNRRTLRSSSPACADGSADDGNDRPRQSHSMAGFWGPTDQDAMACSGLNKQEIASASSKMRSSPLSPEAQRLQARLERNQVDPFRTLEGHIAKGTASLDITRLCLRAAFRDIRIEPRTRRRTYVQQKCPEFAKMVLQYLQAHEDIWQPMITVDFDATWTLSYLAILEGLGDRILSWVSMPARPKELQQLSRGHHAIWRGALFRTLMSATLAQHDTDRMNCALECFISFVDKRIHSREEFRPMMDRLSRLLDPQTQDDGKDSTLAEIAEVLPPICLVGVWPAFCELSSALTTDYYEKIDPRLFDAFVVRYRKFPQVGRLKHMRSVELCLYHPTQPMVSSAVRFLRENPDIVSLVSDSPAPKLALQRFYGKVFLVAQAKGRHGDADWIKRKYKEDYDSSIESAVEQVPRRPKSRERAARAYELSRRLA